jgi:hypothetical protein
MHGATLDEVELLPPQDHENVSNRRTTAWLSKVKLEETEARGLQYLGTTRTNRWIL